MISTSNHVLALAVKLPHAGPALGRPLAGRARGRPCWGLTEPLPPTWRRYLLCPYRPVAASDPLRSHRRPPAWTRGGQRCRSARSSRAGGPQSGRAVAGGGAPPTPVAPVLDARWPEALPGLLLPCWWPSVWTRGSRRRRPACAGGPRPPPACASPGSCTSISYTQLERKDEREELRGETELRD